jgi:hypothetical protein
VSGPCIYVCPDLDCGNAVTEAQVALVYVPHLNVALDGARVLCATAKHGATHPVMRRVEVDA